MKPRDAQAAERHRALAAALLRRLPLWQSASERARRLAHSRGAPLSEAVQLADDYRLLAHDLARARELMPGSRSREFLEGAYARAHATLHHGATHPGRALLELFRDRLPLAVRWLRPYLAWTGAIFLLAGTAGYSLVRRFPELIALVASPELIASVERGKLWTAGLLNIVPSSVLSVQILTNNIVVSLFAYCAGFSSGSGPCTSSD